jgi:hypothetical protein
MRVLFAQAAAGEIVTCAIGPIAPIVDHSARLNHHDLELEPGLPGACNTPSVRLVAVPASLIVVRVETPALPRRRSLLARGAKLPLVKLRSVSVTTGAR